MKKLINRRPAKSMLWFLGAFPFLLLIVIYWSNSNARLQENENDKLLPSFVSMANAVERMAFNEDKRSGEYLMVADTLSSLRRLLLGILISSVVALTIGIMNGAIPLVRASLSPLVTTISLVPPMAVLPILFVILGLGEVSKVALIVIGITPFLIRDVQQRALEIPSEQIIKAQTLGANTWQIILRVILPQIMPRLLSALRLSLGAAWLFLIAAEAIAATDGLGYRIFLVRRYMAMDIILPYVLWITIMAFFLDWVLIKLTRYCYPWFDGHDAEK